MAGTGLRVIEVNTIAGIEPYREDWQQLASRVPKPSVFLTYEWVVTWLESFWRDRSLSILFIFDADRLVAVFPLLVDRFAELWCRNTMVSPVNAHARRGGILAVADLSDVLLASMAFLRRRRSRLRVVMRSVEADSDLLQKLPEMRRRAGLSTLVQSDNPSPEVSIDTGWSEYLSTRKPQVRREMRRKRRKMQAACELEFRVECDRRSLAKTLVDITAIERASWKDPAGSSIVSEGVNEFYARVAERFAARGWLTIYLLYADGVPVAHILGVTFGHRYYALKTSYDHRYRSLAPGAVLMSYALEHAFESRLRFFDLLGEKSRWKGEIATDLRRHWDVCIFPRTALKCQMCRLLRSYVMPPAKRFMPGMVRLGRRALHCGPVAPPPDRIRTAVGPGST